MHPQQRFPTTQWSMIARAGDGDSPAGRAALAALLGRYAGPMRAHLVLGKRIDPDDAEDLVQGFIARRLLEGCLIERADHSKGRFRNFLLTDLDHFVANELRAQRTQKRSPDRLFAIDEGFEKADPSAQPGDVFDVQWARTVIQQAVREMRLTCEAGGRADVWGVFNSRILGPTIHDTEPLPYAQMVEQFGLTSPAHASNLLVTAKRMFVRILRDVVHEYAADECEIDEEISDLYRVLGTDRG
jgi:hypothetical protein